MDEIKKSLFVLGRFKYRLPLMLFLFLTVSLIDVMGIGLIGPFVALLGHQGNIVEDYPLFLSFFGFSENKTIITFIGVSLAMVFCLKGFVAFFVQKKYFLWVMKFEQILLISLLNLIKKQAMRT